MYDAGRLRWRHWPNLLDPTTPVEVAPNSISIAVLLKAWPLIIIHNTINVKFICFIYAINCICIYAWKQRVDKSINVKKSDVKWFAMIGEGPELLINTNLSY